MLASEAEELLGLLDEFGGGEADMCGDEDDMTLAAAGRPFGQAHSDLDRSAGGGGNNCLLAAGAADSTRSRLKRAIGEGVGFQRAPEWQQSVDVQMGAEQRANQNEGELERNLTHHWRLEAIGPAP
jgi:hypothetical protein